MKTLNNLMQLLKKRKQIHTELSDIPSDTYVDSRRNILKSLAALPFVGLFGWGGYRNNKVYGASTPVGTAVRVNQVESNQLKGELPKGKLGNHELSRLIMGGNPIGGWAHSRDLIYSTSLFKAYFTEKKIFETLAVCEQVGINCINIGFVTMPTLVEYRKVTGSKMKVIVQVNTLDNIRAAIDSGMDIIQIQGGRSDTLVRDGNIEPIGEMIEAIRKQGIVAGLAAHEIDSFLLCGEKGIVPDYYMCCMHHDNYWSAHPRENRKKFQTLERHSVDHNMYHGNMFCAFPERAIDFVNSTKVPVMGYKILAAGAIYPQDGFNWAFENGADFICVGMFDFQIVDNTNMCIDTLQNLQNRGRSWYA